ncbi:HNH endonuclease [Paraburkholderia sp. GAS42]
MPLEQGGSNDDGNLNLLCVECHNAKTAQEAAARARG